MSQIPVASSGSLIGGGGQFYSDNASFRYSHQNLVGRASSVVMSPPSVLNMATSQHLNVSTPSVYSEGSMYGGGGMGFSSMMSNNGVMGNVYHPSDEEIRREVQHITATADLTTMTKKQVREQLSGHFGMNMSYRKDFINYCIEEALNF
jgi:chitin synthase